MSVKPVTTEQEKKSKERSYRSYGPSEQKVPVYLLTHKA